MLIVIPLILILIVILIEQLLASETGRWPLAEEHVVRDISNVSRKVTPETLRFCL